MVCVSTQMFQILWHLGLQIMDPQLVFFLSLYYFLSSTNSLQTGKMKTEKTFFLCSSFLWVLWSIGSSDIPTALHRIPPSPQFPFFGFAYFPRVLVKSAPWSNNLTEPYSNFTYTCYGLNSLSPRNVHIETLILMFWFWEVGTLKVSGYECEALTKRISVLTVRREALRTLLSPPSRIKSGQCKMERSLDPSHELRLPLFKTAKDKTLLFTHFVAYNI